MIQIVEVPCCKCGTQVEVSAELSAFRHLCGDCFYDEIGWPEEGS